MTSFSDKLGEWGDLAKFGDHPWALAMRELIGWAGSQSFTVQRATGTRLHELIEDVRRRRSLTPVDVSGQDFFAELDEFIPRPWQVFLVEHDWAAAFVRAEGFADVDLVDSFEFMLPYPDCCFEFYVNGKRVLLLVMYDEATSSYVLKAFCNSSLGWVQLFLEDRRFAAIGRIIGQQLKAIGVALDARVVELDLINASEKLNRARARRGRTPVFDYHVVKIRKVRHPTTSLDAEGRSSPRLHLRRGHWRFSDTGPAWIRWTLVGNPDLGFVDKHYRLPLAAKGDRK